MFFSISVTFRWHGKCSRCDVNSRSTALLRSANASAAKHSQPNSGGDARRGEQSTVRFLVSVLALSRWLPRDLVSGVALGTAALSLAVNRSLRQNLFRVARASTNVTGRLATLRCVLQNMRDKRVSTVDHLRLWRAAPEQTRSMVSFSGETYLKAEHGQKVLILSAHYIGFELALMRLSHEVSGAVVVELTKNSAFNTEVVRFWQRDRPQKVIDSRGGLREIVRTLRSGTPTAVLVEHMGSHPNYLTASWKESMVVRMTPALKLLVADPQTRILWMSIKRDSSGQYACKLDVIAREDEEHTKNAERRITLIGEKLIEAIPDLCWNTLPLNYPASMR
jgi:lauroyl/myristoyl acyltransferase